MAIKPFDKKEEKIKKSKKSLYITIGALSLIAIVISIKTFAAFIQETDSVQVSNATVEDYRKAKYVKYDNTNVDLECENVQCALEKINESLGE